MSKVSLRRRSSRRKSLTAASQAVRDASGFKRPFAGAGLGAGDWQAEAWKYVELVGELDYYVRWRSSSVSRCRLVASVLDERGVPTGGLEETDTGDPTPESARVQDIVNSIGGSGPGQAKVLRRTAYVLSVPGECWVAILTRNPAREQSPVSVAPDTNPDRFQPTEQWYVFDRSEIQVGAREIILTLPDGMKHTFDPGTDVMFRIWDENPRQANLPTSPVWSNRDPLNEIVRSSASIDNASKSRLIGNGVLFVPQEISLPQQAGPAPTPATGSAPTPVPLMAGAHATAQDFQDLLYDVATEAIRNPDSVAATLPIIATAPGDFIKNIQWIRAASDVPATALTTREAAIRRLAMGLDVSPERLLGLGANSNHWSAWAIDETDVKVHIAPLVEMICTALTEQILRPKLIQEGFDPEKYVVWFDATDLTQDPDKKEAATTAFDRGALSGAALREYLGLDTDSGYDLESPDGWLEMMLDRVSQNPADNMPVFEPILRELLTGKLAKLLEPEPPPVAIGPGQPPPEQPGQPQSEPASGPNQSEVGQPGQPQQVNAAGLTIARLCVNRALELANKRRRTRTNAALYRGVPIELAHTVPGMPPIEADDVTELIRGWGNGISDSDLRQAGLDPSRFRSVVYGASMIALVTGQPPVIASSMLATPPSTEEV